MSELDDNAAQREAVRMLRGGILRALQRVLESGTLATLLYLRRVLRPENERLLREALSYLLAAGYVAATENRLDARDTSPLVTYKLTAPGMQLVEGVLTDASVVLD